jgi:nucleoside-diphosphate-sugar epimerase
MTNKRKVLIAGASGLVGYGAVKHFGGRDDWEVIAVSRRPPLDRRGARFISVDLMDEERCREVFGAMEDVTHVVYAALFEKVSTGLIRGWRERDQMETNLAMLRNLFEPLSSAARDLRHVSLLQGTKAYGAHVAPIPIPARERNPRHQHENFYWLQEDYLRAKQNGKNWSWTILRPQIVFGEAIGGNLNVIPALGVYAALRKEDGLPLSYPGGTPGVAEAIDADLLAHSMEWAAANPACANQVFNITNGDVFVWTEVWPVIADAFGMPVGTPEPHSLREEMPARAAEWSALVKKYNLRAPAEVAALVGGSFEFTDSVFGYGSTKAPPPMLVSTVKARQAGFTECIDTEDMFRKWISRWQELRLLPPR